jgi:RNA polymerase sigma-70 factor (ECF subfamily)
MDGGRHADTERSVREQCDASHYDGATTEAVRSYGPEIFGFLYGLLRSDEAASDAFSHFAEDLWRGLPGFAWECSLRTWAYTLARRAAYRHVRKARRALGGMVASPLSSQDIAAQVRTSTLAFLKTETKTRLRALREELPPDDQVLLVLRLDKGLAWDELARILADDEKQDAATRKRVAARLRKRFQVVKERLIARAREEGLA